MRSTLHGQVTLHGNILTDVRIAKDCGYEALELHTDKLLRYLDAGRTAGELKAALYAHSIVPAAIDIIGGIEVQNSEGKEKLFALTKRLCAVAVTIGAKVVQVNPFSGLEGRGIYGILTLTAANLRVIADIGKANGIRFQLEGAAWTPIHTLGQCLELIERTGRDNVGLVIDFWHFWAGRGAEPEDIARLDASMIYGVHLCDGFRPAAGAAWPDERELRGCLPGDGDLPVREWMDAVKSTGYDGFVSGEFLNQRLWEEDLLDVALRMRERMEGYF